MQAPVTRMLILGLGRSGLAVARAVLDPANYGALRQLTIVDAADTAALRAHWDDLERRAAACRPAPALRVFLGATTLPESGEQFELGVVSPGLAPHDPLVVAACQRCDELIGELEFAYRRAPADQKWIALTGSNGKTTTTMLCTHLLRAAGRDAASVGNIGAPVTDQLCCGATPEILVAEVSSFQLHYCTSFAPQAAALLNVAPDHLDWHGSLDNYVRAKQKIFAQQRAGDVALIWDDDPFADRTRACVQATPARLETISFREHAAPAVYLKDAKLWLHLDPSTEPELICPVDDLLIHGRHNVCNALFAAGLVARFGLTAAEIAAGLKTFTAPPHRLELVAEIAGVRYFDDSKATNPDSVRAALTAFAPATVHLLLGGQGKGTPYEDLARSALACARAVYTFGAEGPVLAETFRAIQAQGAVAPSLTACGDLEEAFAAAAEAARPGEAVLLSPACASFDAFDSYAQRGEFFVALVRAQARAGREGPL